MQACPAAHLVALGVTGSPHDGLALDDAEVTLEGAAIEGAGGVGLRVRRTTTLVASGLSLRGGGGAGGDAALWMDGARLSLTRFHIEDNAVQGVRHQSGAAELRDGLITGHPVGLSSHLTELEVGALLGDGSVRFVENERAVELGGAGE